MNKFEPLWDAGARTFMISFDDLRRTLPYGADRSAFGSDDGAYGRANAHLLNAFLAALHARDPSAKLITVGADYSGTHDSAYLRAMRNNLSSQVELIWTGRRVRSRALTPGDARQWTRVAGRSPIVWENWTNLDFVPGRLFMGPWQRDPRLVGDVKGFLLNTAFVPETDFIPFGTAARWFNAPGRYEPRSAFLSMAKEIGGSRAALLRAFAETSYSTTLHPRAEAPSFVRLSNRFLRRLGGPREKRAGRALLGELRLVIRAPGLARNPSLRPMLRDARPFFSSAAREARSGVLATRLLLAGSAGAHSRLVRINRRSVSEGAITYGNRRGWSNLRFGNVMDRFVRRSLRLDAARRRAARRAHKASSRHRA
jgi:hyaluronoglucosaminidase